ncbi:MAG: OadG family protein [Selenomonadaceae bacterium]|nr:OadG family protein [Selenomonadaceae bacterium]MBR3722815.1 OadG family protein [Selenomonadaceae bacterium]
MHQPVTTNPFIIMLINMTVVFLVLIALMYLIKLIHYIDPTKPKAKEAPAPSPVVQEVAIPDNVPQKNDDEVVAAIMAALSSMGEYGTVKAIRPINREGWKQSGRVQNMNF